MQIDKIIKILINFKYKREPFMTWSWGIDMVQEKNTTSKKARIKEWSQ